MEIMQFIVDNNLGIVVGGIIGIGLVMWAVSR